MKSVVTLGLALLAVSAQAGEYDDYAIDPSVVEPEAVCEKYRNKAMPKARPDLTVLATNYSAQVPVYVVSSKMEHGFACGFKVVTKSNEITDVRVEIDAKTTKSHMLNEK